MTVTEMADKIVAACRFGGTSFVEIMAAVGPEATGAQEIHLLPNIVIWCAVSRKFCDALMLTRDRIEPTPTTPLVYMYDGAMLKYPLVKNPRAKYKEPHWAPVVFNPRTQPLPADFQHRSYMTEKTA